MVAVNTRQAAMVVTRLCAGASGSVSLLALVSGDWLTRAPTGEPAMVSQILELSLCATWGQYGHQVWLEPSATLEMNDAGTSSTNAQGTNLQREQI